MGYDLEPKNEDAGDFHMGAFSWSWMIIDVGVGLPFGMGRGTEPASYVIHIEDDFDPDKDQSPVLLCSNDGFFVSAEKAQEMALVAKWAVKYHRAHADVYDNCSDKEKARYIEYSVGVRKLYNLPVRKDFVDKMEKFSEWAPKSGGFYVW